MQPALKTGRPDLHGVPRIVDNYADLGQQELLRGGDGVLRRRLSLRGSYQGKDGSFEWIIESDNSINHRIFVPNP